jgi:hypothetical protein
MISAFQSSPPDWRLRLWADIASRLPAGRVGVWACPTVWLTELPSPPGTLLEHVNLTDPHLPAGAALDALVLVMAGRAAAPWPAVLQAALQQLAPEASCFLLSPRGGMVALQEPGWQPEVSSGCLAGWLQAAGLKVRERRYIGGAAWPHPWATAACTLWICQRAGVVPPQRLQFSRKESGTATATGVTGAAGLCCSKGD